MNPANIAQAMQTALRHHQAGQLDEAQAIYRGVLARTPNHADALRSARCDRAANGPIGRKRRSHRPAIACNPNVAEYHYNLGNVLSERNQHDRAISAFRNALRLRPDYADALYNLANAPVSIGRIDDAIAALLDALKVRPDDAKIHDNLGRMLKDNGRLDDAIAAFRRAIELKPDFAEAHSNLVYAVNFHPDFDAAAILRESRSWADRHDARLHARLFNMPMNPFPIAG